MNEEALGKGVARAIADGLTTREELFITTKVWVQDTKSEDTAYEAVKASLQKLNLDYGPGAPPSAHGGLFRRLLRHRKGLSGRAGPCHRCCQLLSRPPHQPVREWTTIPPVNQVELHPFFVQQRAIDNMKAYGVVPQA